MSCRLFHRWYFSLSKSHGLLIILFFFFFSIFLFFWTNPNFDQSGTVKIWDRNNILLYEQAGVVGSKQAITYDKLPQSLIDAVIVSEDQSFWHNPGVDFSAMFRSLYLNVREGQIVSGASTITQQLARAGVISPGKISQRSWLRKVREILMAIRLKATYSKKEILTMYLNKMYFGNLTYGVGSASALYFGKDVSRLSIAESAFLAGLISAPEARNPYVNFPLAKKRQEFVLGLLKKNNLLKKEEVMAAQEEPLTIIPSTNRIKAPHFVHFVMKEIEKLGIKNTNGLNVFTTLDYPVFKLSQDLARLWVERLKTQHDLSNASLVLINNNTGEILNMLGGIDYFDATNSGEVNLAISLRQPGSALKPITYAAAFSEGFTPATLIYDVPSVYKTKKGEGFTPNNYDGRYHGLVLARDALASSLNLPAVEMLHRIGLEKFLETAEKLGITTFTQKERYDLSITLGGGEVTLLELTNVYASLAREGQYLPTFSIEKITTDEGKNVFQHKRENPHPIFEEQNQQIAYLISDILSDPKARILGFGEKNPLVLSRPAAVKTGTTTDWHDNWTVGYTPSFTLGVWVGNNDNHPMKQITGVVGAAPLWNQFFEEYLRGKPKEQFIKPEGIKEVKICKLSGQLYDGLCPEQYFEKFIDKTEPKAKSTLHKRVKIDLRNNLLANKSCPVEFVTEKILVNYPSEVFSWAVQNDQPFIPQNYSPFCDSDNNLEDLAFLAITNPKAKAVFENAPQLVTDQAIVFEANVSSAVLEVIWLVDGVEYGRTREFPFNFSWRLVNGKHRVKAIGRLRNGNEIKSEEVEFSVVGYKENF